MKEIQFRLSPRALVHFSLTDGLGILGVKTLRQVHGASGHQAEKISERLEGDWLWSDSETPIGIFVADCTAVLMEAKRNGASVRIAIHGGWRGTAANIFESAVQSLNLSDAKAWMSPSISQMNYEVGEDVRSKFSEKDFFKPSRPAHYFFDLKGLQIQRLKKLGVETIVNPLCTYAQPEFFSYRRAHGKLNARHLAWIT